MRIFLLVLIVGAICYNYTQSATVANVVMMTLMQLPFFVVIAWSYWWLKRCFVGRWPWTKGVFYAVFVFYAIVSIVECYLCFFVNSGYTQNILTFLLQTDAGEANGFLHAYIANKMFFLFVISVLVAALLIWCVNLFLPSGIMSNPWLKTIVMASFVYVFLFPTFPCTSVSRLANALYHYSDTKKAEEKICYDAKIQASNADPHLIVLIIGEAFSKHHSSLYGYDKQTNPCLEELVESGNLYVFNDVVAPYNKTHMMLKELLSMHSVDAPIPWSDYPLWPQIFRDAGYYVSFISNQVPSVASGESVAYFFQDKDVERRCFNYRNGSTYRYDEGLLNELQTISSLSHCPKELTILHLNGQHIYATYNFPHEHFTIFQPSDYIRNKLNLDSRQVQELADYDNATLYNDYVVSQIMRWYEGREAIVVYLSDHGEEVHDYRPFLGRSHETVPTREELKYQYEIPFMIFMTDEYKQKNADVVRRVESACEHRFMSDDIPHMLLGVSGIETGWYDASRNVLSPVFNPDRSRIFGY